MADLEIPLLDPDAQVKCETCDWSGKWSEARTRIIDFSALTAVANNVPAGQCPICSSLVFLAKGHSAGDHGLSYTAKSLFPLFSNLQSGLVKLMSEGVLTPENMGDHWDWLQTTLDKIEMSEHDALVIELNRILDDE
jgi:hypothetical protein